MLTLCAQAPSTRWLAQLLGAPGDEVESIQGG